MKASTQMTIIKTGLGRMFSMIFLTISLCMVVLAGRQFYVGLMDGKELVNIFVQSINTLIVSLAIFELGIGILKEYGSHEEESNIYTLIRRTVARFVGTVSIALVLESLIMIIKYSQLDLAGNLHYPVAILVGASVLLIGLGLFLHLSRKDCEEREERMPLWQPHREAAPSRKRPGQEAVVEFRGSGF